MKSQLTGIYILIITAVLVVLGFTMSDPIVQPEEYHQFSDTKRIFGIPNFWNVISNLPFLVIGISGIKHFIHKEQRMSYLIFFAGITLCFFGSCYYHLNPSTDTLVWDRLPMTIGFMALVAIVIKEYVSVRLSNILIWPLIAIGFISIIYWVTTGDLRLYGLVQFYPMIALPVIILFYKSEFTAKGYWLLFIFYIIAKVLEYFDHEVFHLLNFIGGHPLKHLSAAIGVYLLLQSYKGRNKEVSIAE